MGDLRDRLMSRRLPTAPCRIRIEDTTEAESRLQQTLLTLGAAKTAQQRGEDVAESVLQEAHASVQEAIEALSALYVTVVLSALRPEDFEALIAEHPARDEDTGRWNGDTFPPALFIACAPKDLTEQEWADFLRDRLSEGERDELYAAAVALNTRAPRMMLPKDMRRQIYESS